MTKHGEGTFQNQGWDEQTTEEFDDAKITHAQVKQSFDGVMSGDAAISWDMFYAPDGTAAFVGLQRVVGTIDGRKGAVVIQTTGTFDGKEAAGDWVVVGATGELAGLSGTGEFSAPLGPSGRYTREYDL